MSILAKLTQKNVTRSLSPSVDPIDANPALRKKAIWASLTKKNLLKKPSKLNVNKLD